VTSLIQCKSLRVLDEVVYASYDVIFVQSFDLVTGSEFFLSVFLLVGLKVGIGYPCLDNFIS
jgi:hypothetical protein